MGDRLLKNVLGKGVGRVLDNLADLNSFPTKLHDSVPGKLPGSIGDVLNAKVKI